MKKDKTEEELIDISTDIYKFLKRRAIIVKDNISHEIYKDFFTATFIFNKIYEIGETELLENYYTYKDKGKVFLEEIIENKLSQEDLPWPSIACNLLQS